MPRPSPRLRPSARKRQKPILGLGFGTYRDRAPLQVPSRGCTDAHNVRVRNGRIGNIDMGWTRHDMPNLDGQPVLYLDEVRTSADVKLQLAATDLDFYSYSDALSTVAFLTPRYETGTVSITNGTAVATFVGSDMTKFKATDRIHFTATGQTDPTATWYEILSVDVGMSQVTLTANLAESTHTGVAFTNRRVFVGGKNSPWVAEFFPLAQGAPGGADRFYATNGAEAWSWDLSADQVTPYDPGFTFRTIRRIETIMIYGDITELGVRKPGTIRSSAILEPENVSTKEAAELQIADAPVLLIEPLGETAVVYGGSSGSEYAILMQFVGIPLIWTFRQVLTGIGPRSARGVVNRGDFHEFLARDAAHRFDGVGTQKFGSQLFRDAIRSYDGSRSQQHIAFLDWENGETLWVLPRSGDAQDASLNTWPVTRYLAAYLEEESIDAPTPVTSADLTHCSAMGSFSRESARRFSDLNVAGTDEFDKHDVPFDDRFFSGFFPEVLFGDGVGNVYRLNDGHSHAGGAYHAFARFPPFPADGETGRLAGIIHRIYVGTTHRPAATHTLTVALLVSQHADGNYVQRWSSEFALNHSGQPYLSPMIGARFAALQYSTIDVNEPWDVSMHTWHTSLAGDT